MTRTRRTSGAALAELVILAPLLLIVLLGILQAAQAGSFLIEATSAAEAGVLYGAQNHTTALDHTGMATAAANDADNAALTAVATDFCLCANGATSTCGASGACSTTHQNLFVQVVVSGTMPTFINYSALPAGLRTVTVSQTAIMRVTQ